MDEYIKRSVVVHRVMETKWEHGSDGATAMEIVASAPAEDVVLVRHGYWVIDDNNTRECHCSECDWPAPRDVYEYHREQTGYCPVCGAKMEIDYYE